MPETCAITACILARNEGQRIEPALQSLQGWTVQIIVIDNDSDDDTVAIARRYGALVLSAPTSVQFDGIRNLAIEHAIGDMIFFLDADERVPPALGQALQRLVRERGDEFEAMSIPFKHYFCGQWMQHSGWWPGYTRPQLLKKGRFQYGERLHSGVRVDGRTLYFPADDPDFAIVHYSYDDLNHYMTKLNRYTDGEAESLLTDRKSHSWQAQLGHFVQDWQGYYERGRADLDGMHGFVLSFLSGFYRFIARAKLWELRYKEHETTSREPMPSSVREMLEFMAGVSQEGAGQWLNATHSHTDIREIPQDWLEEKPEKPRAAAQLAAIEGKTGITACILARNAAHQIEDALKSLLGWTDRIIVIDNESGDETAAIARRYTDLVLTAPHGDHFDALRNLAIEHIEDDWILYLDADERVPPRLGPMLARLVRERGTEFEGVCLPFKNHYYGKWMRSGAWWPGYKGPQLLKKGAFEYGARVHSGAQVTGRTLNFPADDPDLAIDHYAFSTLSLYLTKINRYTDDEARDMHADGIPHSWQAMLAAFVHDWQVHFDQLSAHEDGMHGFIQSFLCAFYRFLSVAKLWDLRRKQGELPAHEGVPASLREMLEFMAQVVVQESGGALHPDATPNHPTGLRLPLIWQGPLLDASGFADGARNLILGLIALGENVALVPERWGADVPLAAGDFERLKSRFVGPQTAAEILVSNTLPRLIRRDQRARVHAARIMFETDRLPKDHVAILNTLDRIWVPTEFNRETFRASGVDPDKLVVIPEAIDPAPFAAAVEPWPVPGCEPFKFLSAFDWTLHKGWDVLLEAFARAFGDNTDVGLVIKTWSSHPYTFEQIQQQADAHLQAKLGRPLRDFTNIHLWQETLPVEAMPRLYQAVQCYVAASRCEGWCRPLMEAMAFGLPTIATGWGGMTAFHNDAIGYPVKYTLAAVSEAGARETPIYDGHRWAEPDMQDLQRWMRHTVRYPEAARRKGRAAQQSIAVSYARPIVASRLREEIARCRDLATARSQEDQHATVMSRDVQLASTQPAAVATRERSDAILIQSAAGEHTHLLELTRAHHEQVARRLRMDFVCRAGLQQQERPAQWDKILLIRQALEAGYAVVVWLDADTLIVDPMRDLREALPPNAWLGMVKHGTMPPWFNSGAIYVRNTPQSRAYFAEVWRTYPADHFWEDNMAMIRVLGFDPERWRGAVVIGDEWNSTRLMNECAHPVVKAWHGNGPVAQRFQMMRREMQTLPNPSFPQAATATVPAPTRPVVHPLTLEQPPSVNFRAALGRALRVRWEGDFNVVSSLANINREFCLRLLARGDVELALPGNPFATQGLPEAEARKCRTLFARCGAHLTGEPDVVVRHHWPPDWNPPSSGKLVVIQPWELSHLPGTDWVAGASHLASEVWVHSRFVRDTYVRSSVPAERVRLVPLGVDLGIFSPEGPERDLPLHPRTGRRPLRFLFVGGTIDRKGAGLLLEAYLRAFTADDLVCLVVKDMGAQTFYRGQNLAARFLQVATDPNAPQVVYLDDDLTTEEMAALYRACDCVVAPYRAEGFALAPLEGMACGLPAIVTAGGPTDDYLDDACALRVPFRRRVLTGHYRGPNAFPADPWDLEPDGAGLIEALRWVRDHPEQARERGREARQRVMMGWGWERAADVACTRLSALVAPRQTSPVVPARPWSGPKRAPHAPRKGTTRKP